MSLQGFAYEVIVMKRIFKLVFHPLDTDRQRKTRKVRPLISRILDKIYWGSDESKR